MRINTAPTLSQSARHSLIRRLLFRAGEISLAHSPELFAPLVHSHFVVSLGILQRIKRSY